MCKTLLGFPVEPAADKVGDRSEMRRGLQNLVTCGAVDARRDVEDSGEEA
jgi:hypothetical protein